METTTKTHQSSIFTVHSLKQILTLKQIHFNSIVYWDLDSIILHTPHGLGSKQWITQLAEIAKIKLHGSVNHALIKELYNAVQYFIEVESVKSEILKVIQYLQHIGIQQRFLTSRHPGLSKLTISQLEKIAPGIEEWLSPFQIIFCDAQQRGKILTKNASFFSSDHMIIIDGQYQNIEQFQTIADRLELDFTGIHYHDSIGYQSSVSMQNANLQLLAIQHLLPLHIQNFIQQLNDVEPFDTALYNSR